MANEFITILDKAVSKVKEFFESPITTEVATQGIKVAEVAFPALDTVLAGLQKSFATATVLASTAAPATDTTAQVAAIVLADSQQVFQTYQTATGTTLETAHQKAIIAAFENFLAQFPAPTATKTVVVTEPAAEPPAEPVA